MTYELKSCADGHLEAEVEECRAESPGTAWRCRAKSLCDVTWEPVCILKFLSQECIYCEQKLLVTELQLPRTKVTKRSSSDNDTEESSDDNAIEIIKSVQLKPAAKNVGDKGIEHVCSGTTTEECTVPVVIPVSVSVTKPTSGLPSWGLLPPVEEEGSGTPTAASGVSSPLAEETEFGDFYSSEANNEILNRAYEVINENDDLLTALDKLEHHIKDDSDNLVEKSKENQSVDCQPDKDRGSKESKPGENDSKKQVSTSNEQNSSTSTDGTPKYKVGLTIEPKPVGNVVDTKEKEKSDSKIPKFGKSTSNAKNCDSLKSKSSKGSGTKQKEGNRLIRALNWVSKLPGKITTEKQGKKHDQKHGKHEETKDDDDSDEYGFFIKLNPRRLSDRQEEAAKRKSQTEENTEKQTAENKVINHTVESNTDTGNKIVTEVLSVIQPELDTHFQENLRRFHNIDLSDSQTNNGNDGKATHQKDTDDSQEEAQMMDDRWEPRQTGSLPNLAGEFLSTSPPMERIRQYIMQDDSDDSSLDEFLLIPVTTDFEETVGSVSGSEKKMNQYHKQEKESNSGDVHEDSIEHICKSDEMTSSSTNSNLTSDANERLPHTNLQTAAADTVDTADTENTTDRHTSKPNGNTVVSVLRPTQLKLPEFTRHKNQSPSSIPGFGRGKRGAIGPCVSRNTRRTTNTPPYATPPRPIRAAQQSIIRTGALRHINHQAPVRGRGIPRAINGVTHTGLSQAQAPTATCSVDGQESANICSRNLKLSNKHGTRPSQLHAGRENNPICSRISHQPGTAIGKGSTSFHYEQQHYIASHKPTNIHTVNSQVIHKAKGPSFSRPLDSSNISKGQQTGSRINTSALQNQGKSSARQCNNNSSISTSNVPAEAEGNYTPVRASQDQSKLPQVSQVRHPAGEPNSHSAKAVQSHKTHLSSETPGTTEAGRHISAAAVQLPQQPQQQKRSPSEVRRTVSRLEATQDCGSGNWMDSGVQMDFTDES